MTQLISAADMLALTDRLAVAWDHADGVLGNLGEEDAPAVGSAQEQILSAIDDVIFGTNEYHQTSDLLGSVRSSLEKCNRESTVANALLDALTAIDSHCNRRGSSVSATIIGLNTFQVYRNVTRFTSLVSPEFAALWVAAGKPALNYKGVYAPAWHPSVVAAVSANGFGARAVGGSFAAGTALDVTKYSEVDLIAEVTTNFANGTGVPTLSVTGVDHTGATMTWTASFATNNPTAAMSTTLNGALTASRGKRATVTLTDATGVIAGSVLRINAGGPNEEYVVVESVSSNDVVAYIRKNHADGEAVAWNRPLLLTPGTGGRKCASVSAITINVTGHDAGAVRIVGKQPRVMQHGS